MKRNFEIDFLRCIGLIGILLSHSKCPIVLMQLRSFDVPLMVFVSALCSMNFSSNVLNFGSYIQKRFIRLVLPVWIFVLLSSTGIFPHYELPSILFGGIVDNMLFLPRNYFWIIRVFFIMSIITPFLIRFVRSSNIYLNGLILILLVLVNEYLSSSCPSYWGEGYAKGSLIMFLGYTIIVYFSIMSSNCKRRHLFMVSVISLIFVVLYSITNKELISAYKYPPHFIYLIYGIGCSLFLYSIKSTFAMIDRFPIAKSFISFVGSHTIWIYIWHIPVISIFQNSYCWEIRFLIILLIPATVCYVQSLLVNSLSKKISEHNYRLIERVFIG